MNCRRVIFPTRCKIRQRLVLIIRLMRVAATIFFCAMHVRFPLPIDSSADAHVHRHAVLVEESGKQDVLLRSLVVDETSWKISC